LFAGKCGARRRERQGKFLAENYAGPANNYDRRIKEFLNYHQRRSLLFAGMCGARRRERQGKFLAENYVGPANNYDRRIKDILSLQQKAAVVVRGDVRSAAARAARQVFSKKLCRPRKQLQSPLPLY